MSQVFFSSRTACFSRSALRFTSAFLSLARNAQHTTIHRPKPPCGRYLCDLETVFDTVSCTVKLAWTARDEVAASVSATLSADGLCVVRLREAHERERERGRGRVSVDSSRGTRSIRWLWKPSVPHSPWGRSRRSRRPRRPPADTRALPRSRIRCTSQAGSSRTGIGGTQAAPGRGAVLVGRGLAAPAAPRRSERAASTPCRG